MTDSLETIRLIIEFHHTVRSQLHQISGSISDIEALFSLRSEFAGWSQTSLDELSSRMNGMQRTFSLLESGLGQHFKYEEDNLPSILGGVLMQGLLFEHAAIRKQILAVKGILSNTDIQKLERQEVSLHKSRFQTVLSTLLQDIEKHASREEVVLDMAREGLENR